MPRLVALLRGVNVGGVKLTNAQMVAKFEGAGFTNVRAVLASGNIVFDADVAGATERLELAHRLEETLSAAFNYDAKLVLETQDKLRHIFEKYPFERVDAEQHPYVVFSSSTEQLAAVIAASKELPLDVESVAEGDAVIYWRVPKGSSLESPFAKVLARRQFASNLTTRNLRTVEKLAKA